MLAIKTLSALLFSMSLLHPSTSEPIPNRHRYGYPNWSTPTPTTCPSVPKTTRISSASGVQTLTIFAPAPCPTSTATAFESGCTRQFFPPSCIRPLCLLLTSTTEGCPGGCCPTQAPTVTTTLPCTATCQRGCGTFVSTVTVGCKSTSTSTATATGISFD